MIHVNVKSHGNSLSIQTDGPQSCSGIADSIEIRGRTCGSIIIEASPDGCGIIVKGVRATICPDGSIEFKNI